MPVNKLSSMPPQRIRNGFDDSRSEASSTREKQPAYTGVSRGRRNGTSTLAGSNLKDVTNAQTISSGQQGDAAVSVRISRMASNQVTILIATPLRSRSTGRLSIPLYYMPIATCIASTPHQPLCRHTTKGCLYGPALDSIHPQWHGIVRADVLAKTF